MARETVARGRDSPDTPDTLLGALLDLCDRSTIAERLVRDEVTLLMVAGHETTAQALTWTLYLVAAHPDCQAQLRVEIDEAFGGDEPAVEACARLPFLSRVITESLRLYPPSPIIDRCADRPLDFDRWTILAGHTVFVSPFVTQRDPRFFADADQFEPDRWATPQEPLAAAAYFPFGAGPRRCVGEAFATVKKWPSCWPLCCGSGRSYWMTIALRSPRYS